MYILYCPDDSVGSSPVEPSSRVGLVSALIKLLTTAQLGFTLNVALRTYNTLIFSILLHNIRRTYEFVDVFFLLFHNYCVFVLLHL
jgi:hypothetical protein